MSIKDSWKNNKVAEKVKQIKRPTKEKSHVRKDKSKRMAFFVWLFILGMLCIATLSILLSIHTRSHLNETNRVVEARENEEVVEEIPQASANEFLSSFTREYINVPNESDALVERANHLKEYMVFSDEFNDDRHPIYQSEGSGTRTLNSMQLFHILEDGEDTFYQYKVTFTNEIETEVETGKGKDKQIEIEVEEEQQTLLLTIPFIYEDGLFSITSVPYFSEVPSLAGNIEYEKEAIDLEEYNGNEKEDLTIFLNTFFERYATEPIDEMAYLMEEPQSLNGSFLFEEIRDITIYEDGDMYKVFLNVLFKDSLTDIQQANDVEMDISKNGSNFYVERFSYN